MCTGWELLRIDIVNVDQLQIESEEIAIFNTLSSRFLTRKRYDALTWAR